MEKKRKAQEQLRQEEEKRLKTITAGEEGGEPKEKPDEDHASELARQQQEIIRQQEALLQKQEKHIEDQERRIRLMELGQEKRAEQTIPQQIQPQQFRSAQKPSTSSGAGTIDKILRPSALKFLSCVKKEKETKEEEQEDEEVMIKGVTEAAQTTRIYSKSCTGSGKSCVDGSSQMERSGKMECKRTTSPKSQTRPNVLLL